MVVYAAKTPEEYMTIIDPDWRYDTLEKLRLIIREVAPDWEEVINYKMLGYGPPGEPVMHLNAQKGYVGLYVGDIKMVDPDGSILGPMDNGKGCVRFKKKNAVDGRIRVFLERYVALKRDGVDMGC